MLMETATLFSLLAMYAQEKRDKKTRSVGGFQDWLIIHDFGKIKEGLSKNSAILLQIDEFLQTGFENINAKLEVIENSVIKIAERMEGVDRIAASSSQDELSDQAIKLLQWFEATNQPEMVVAGLGEDRVAVIIYPMINGVKGFEIEEARFLKDDLEMIMTYGWITQSSAGSTDSLTFALTRLGARAAKQFSSTT